MSGDFFFGVFLFLLLRWLALLFNLLAFPRLRPRPTPPKPTASLLVPARNEAENLKRTLPDRKSTRLNSSHVKRSRMPSSA